MKTEVSTAVNFITKLMKGTGQLSEDQGSGYMCKSACNVGLTREQLFLLPSELTLWADPYEVSYRIGEDGSTCVLYESTPPSFKNLSSVDSCKDKMTSLTKSFNMMTVSS
uniref:Anti-proliferative protein domain-containing protein n=1 Tax=Electrophorus electricus TaxID=8005 RepID=A0A4W4DQ35_ELEEL